MNGPGARPGDAACDPDAMAARHAVTVVESFDWVPRFAHDLRSPLVAIGYATQLLRSGRAPAQKSGELFATIDRQTAVLTRLAVELGDLLSIRRDEFRSERQSCDLRSILREAVLDPANGVTTAIAVVDEGDAVAVEGDRGRLVQLLRHVLALAGKRKPGSGQLRLDLRQDSRGVAVRLQDAATAIYENDALRYLMQGTLPFDPGVLGLGDLIARRILVDHQGSMSADPFVDGRTGCIALQIPAPDMPLPS